MRIKSKIFAPKFNALKGFFQLYFLLWAAFGSAFAQKNTQIPARTTVSGRVIDARNEEALPYVTLQFGIGREGVRSDIAGHFLLESPTNETTFTVSYLGYETQVIAIQAGKRNEITVRLQEKDRQLREIIIRPEKYKRDNPATDLIEEVFRHKDLNRKEGLAYYQFEKHERMRFDVNGVTDKFRNRWYFRKFQFAFDFCDTNRVNQKITLPFFLRERILEAYYRREPSASKKERLMGERQTAFDDDYNVDKDGVSAYLTQLYGEIDIYEPSITLLDKQFVGPLSSAAQAFYRFYITDTVQIGAEKFADVFFAPKNKNDLAFMGNLLVALDSSYAVRRVEMGISKDINLNWVSDLHIEQEYTFQGEGTTKRLLLDKDVLTIDMKIWKNRDGRSLLTTKTNTYKYYVLNRPLPDSLFGGNIVMLRDTGKLDARPTKYWDERRHNPLTPTEADIAVMIDSVKNTLIFKRLMVVGNLLGSGFHRTRWLDIGDLGNFYTFNDLEGTRLRMSLRTNDGFSTKYLLRGYTAYGFKDQNWKFGGNATMAFKGARVRRFPANQVRISYEHDLRYPGLGSGGGENIFTSIQTGRSDRLLLNRIVRAEYAREYRNGFSYSGNVQRRAISGAGALIAPAPSPGEPAIYDDAVTTEIGTWLRYAPNERFFQTKNERINIANRWPVFYFQYRAGLKDVLGGDYAYQRASLRMDKIFYLSFLGKSRLSMEGGKIFGQVSYPFLEIPRANQTYFFDEFGFSLLRYIEFVNDQYVTLHYNHDFGGLLLNRVPGIRKLRWREGFSFKALYGSLSEKNLPTTANGLLPFPKDEDGNALTRGLGRDPYLEIGAGIGNIFGFMRIESIWRLTYKDAPGASVWGLKILMGGSF